jgi:hypothetical protein
MPGMDSAFDGPLASVTVKTTAISARGVVLASVEGIDGGEADTEAPIHGALGVVSRPLDADEDGAAEAVCARASDGLTVLATRDLRLEAQRTAAPEKGTTQLLGYRGASVTIAVAASGTGSVLTLSVPFDHVGGAPQKTHAITLDPATGQEAITVAAAGGATLELAEHATCTGGDLRVPESDLVVGDPVLARDVALAQPVIDVLAQLVPMVAAIAAAVNGLAPGSIPPSEIADLVASGAPFVAGGATCRAPRILGEPGT